MSFIEEEDNKALVEQNGDLFKLLENNTLFVTGATGFLGSAIVKALLFYNNISNANIRIIALVRDEQKAIKIFNQYLSSNLTLIIGSVEKLPVISEKIDFIVHGASVTSSFDFVNMPVDTIKTALGGTQNILELAHLKKVKSLLHLSSMEVYGYINKAMGPISENDYGYIDILQTRNSYPVSKQMTENMCVAFAKQYNVHVSIARLTQVLGPGIDYNDTRIAAYFARSVIERRNIVLNTEGTVTRNIIYIRDAVSAVLTLLLKGDKGSAYNIAQTNDIMSIAETAKMLANKIAQNQIKVIFDLKEMPEYVTNKDLYLKLDTTKIERLGWTAVISTEEAYVRMIDGLKNEMDS